MTAKKRIRFFLDAEFNENAGPFKLDPISIALVPEDESEKSYYGVSKEFDHGKLTPWVVENVVRHLPAESQRISNEDIRKGIMDYFKQFATADEPVESVEIWAYNGGTDQVVLAHFFGGLTALREEFKKAGLPKPLFRDLKELTRATGETLPPPENAHDCHADAMWNRELFKVLSSKLPSGRKFLIE